MELSEGALLRDQIDYYFNNSELETLCFGLGIDHENLEGQTKLRKCQSLILYICKHGQIETLLTQLKSMRAHVQWDEISSENVCLQSKEKIPSKSGYKQAQLILEGDIAQFDHYKVKTILAALLEIELDSVKIMQVQQGSIELVIELPEEAADRLFNLYLANDERLKKMNLSSLRLVDHDIYQLLAQLDDIPAMKSFAESVIGPLADYDQTHRSNLVETIDAYFKNQGSISKTAESLFIHRNTLLYRLDRIMELTKLDVNQEEKRLGLHLALKLWQLQGDRG